MSEVYVLKLEQEDFLEIYGVYTSYLEAAAQRDLLKKYNPCVQYGEFKIYEYSLNETYVNKEPSEIK